MLQDEQLSSAISWNEAGDAVIVHSIEILQESVLAKYFRHNKYASFVRQVHSYGFRRVSTLFILECTSEKMSFISLIDLVS